MVDHWFGKLMATIDAQDLWNDTVVIVTTDHGHDLGERGNFGKQFPHFDSHANIPLLVWHPRFPGEGRAVAGLTSTVDLFASILDVGGIAAPQPTHSRSILPLISGEAVEIRTELIYGTFGQGMCCTDGEWTLIQPPDRAKPVFAYSSMVLPSLQRLDPPVGQGNFVAGVETAQWKMPFTADSPADRRPLDSELLLYNRAVDPGQLENVAGDEPEQVGRMKRLMRDALGEVGQPDELLARLSLQ